MSDEAGFSAGFQRHLDVDPILAVTREAYEPPLPPPTPIHGNVLTDPRLPVAVDISDWASMGACRSQPSAWWFESSEYDKGRPICRRCPVRQECLEYAISAKEEHGLWGGMSRHERRRIVKLRGAA